MSFLSSITSYFYGDRTQELPSFDKAKEVLRIWCRDLDLPLSLEEDERTNTLAIKIFDQGEILKIKDAVGRRVYKKRQDFSEYVLDLDCIDYEGKGFKWICFDRYGQNPAFRKKEFFLLVESPAHSNQFYEKAHYLWEENVQHEEII